MRGISRTTIPDLLISVIEKADDWPLKNSAAFQIKGDHPRHSSSSSAFSARSLFLFEPKMRAAVGIGWKKKWMEVSGKSWQDRWWKKPNNWSFSIADCLNRGLGCIFVRTLSSTSWWWWLKADGSRFCWTVFYPPFLNGQTEYEENHTSAYGGFPI